MAVDPNIPSVPSTVPTDQAPWFTAVKGCIEILMGQGRNTDANRALRVSEYRAGITKIQESLPEHILAQSMDIPAPHQPDYHKGSVVPSFNLGQPN